MYLNTAHIPHSDWYNWIYLSNTHGKVHVHHKHHLEHEVIVPLLLRVRADKETLRFGFGQSPQGLMYQGVPVGTKASLWAPHSPAC